MTTSGRRHRVVMLLENNPYPQDVRVRNEAEALTQAGHDVTVLAPRGPGQLGKERAAGVAVRRYWLPVSSGGVPGFLLEYLVAHIQLFVRGVRELLRGADVVHLHNPPDTLFPIGLVARALGRKVVFDHHDLFPELTAEKFGSSGLTALAATAQRASLRVATRVLVTNRSQADIVLARGALRAERVTVVRNGPRRATLGRRRDSRDGVLADPHLVFVGELDVQDGVLMLPDLLVSPGLERATLTVIGDGAVRDELWEGFVRAGMTERVRLVGYVAHEQVPELLATADICIDPAPCTDLNHRSTMIKVAEYLAAGRPVVAFGLAETHRTAEDAALYADCGNLGQFASLISRLGADGELRSNLGKRAAERAAELVWEHSEVELLGVYEDL